MTKPEPHVTRELSVSHFVVASEAFSEAGIPGIHRLVLATRSGRIFRFSTDFWQALCAGDFSHVSPCHLRRLIEAHILTRARDSELAEVLAENKQEIEASRQLYEVIQPSAFCQLGCSYCGQKHTRKQLDSEGHRRIAERIAAKFERRSYDRLHIGWFGAEPLAGLASIRALTPLLQEIATRNGATYSTHIVTNGVKLDARTARELSSRHAVQAAEVTLDGPADQHDARRFFKTGGPSFDRILRNLVDIAREPDLPLAVTVRCNVDSRNAAHVDELIDTLADAGLGGKVNLYFAPVHDWGNEASSLSLKSTDYARLELEWTVYAMSRGFGSALLPSRKKIVCMAVQSDSEVIDAYGNVFNCTETPYVDAYGTPNKHRIGTLDRPETDRSVNVFGRFNEDVAAGAYGCSRCPMLPVCGGACPKSWAEGQAACPSFKFNMPDRLLASHALRKLTGLVETVEQEPTREDA